MKQEQLADLLGKVVPLRNKHVLTVKKIDLGELLNGSSEIGQRKWAARMSKLDLVTKGKRSASVQRAVRIFVFRPMRYRVLPNLII